MNRKYTKTIKNLFSYLLKDGYSLEESKNIYLFTRGNQNVELAISFYEFEITCTLIRNSEELGIREFMDYFELDDELYYMFRDEETLLKNLVQIKEITYKLIHDYHVFEEEVFEVIRKEMMKRRIEKAKEIKRKEQLLLARTLYEKEEYEKALRIYESYSDFLKESEKIRVHIIEKKIHKK